MKPIDTTRTNEVALLKSALQAARARIGELEEAQVTQEQDALKLRADNRFQGPRRAWPPIPERWMDAYACIVDGEVEDADLEKQLIEELGAAEAKVRELVPRIKELEEERKHLLAVIAEYRERLEANNG